MTRAVLTESEMDELGRRGFLRRRAFFDREEIALLKAACERDESLAHHTYRQNDGEGGEAALALWNHPGDDLYGMFARCERMVGAMEQMLGGEVYHYHSKLIWKRPGDGAFAWHQDYGYWYDNGCLRPDMASCLIAIDRAERANGCLQVLEGSHHMGRIDHVQSGGQVVADPERLGEVKKVLDLVHCELDPGDALFTHCNLLHRSDPNHSDRTRYVLICCYNAASNDPYKEHHHPRYTPLERVPDEAIKKVGLRLGDPGKAYLDLDDIEAFDPHG